STSCTEQGPTMTRGRVSVPSSTAAIALRVRATVASASAEIGNLERRSFGDGRVEVLEIRVLKVEDMRRGLSKTKKPRSLAATRVSLLTDQFDERYMVSPSRRVLAGQ